MATSVNDPLAARAAGADWLSLALIDARNHNLRWLAAFEDSRIGPRQGSDGLPPALWLAGHAAWYADWWIVRHVLASRGEDGDPRRPRLAPADPRSDLHFQPDTRPQGTAPDLPTPDAVRVWMADHLENVLELLSGAGDDDRALYLYRQALRHEDRTTEALAVLAQALDLPAGPPRPTLTRRDAGPLWMPAQRWMLGSPPGGLVPGPERWAHAVSLPAFEIDARAVTWQRYVEFAQDGGYDDERWWTPVGWAWAQRVQRRAPRHVEQMRQGVVLQRQGRLQRAPGDHAAVHVTRHEAQAWCRWAGRRLPTEPEWELAACTGASRGFVWGEVLEWVGGRPLAWPGQADPPGEFDRFPAPGAASDDVADAAHGVQRGASLATPARAVHAKARRFAAPDDDLWFTGFRSCAI